MISDLVRAGWPAFTSPLEGRIAWMYLDVLGLVTIGLGCLIDPIGGAMGLPFVLPSGEPASKADIEGAWRATKCEPPGRRAYWIRERR